MGPVIGVTTAHLEEEINTYPRHYYVQAIYKSGATPILIPVIPDQDAVDHYMQIVDGLILSGGTDVDPKYFGQEPIRGTGRVYPERDSLEIALARKALKLKLPVLGICRGIQVLNIAFGGDIYQDIYSQVPGVLEHSQKAPRNSSWHSIELLPESKVGRILGVKELRVNSFHHQAIRNIAPGFRVVARSRDGIIEGIETENHQFVIGVQWHPEALVEDDDIALNLFQAFIKACY